MARLKSSIWVAAYLRRCQTEGVFGAVRKRGSEDAGAVFVKVATLDGNAVLYAPAPQTVYDESRPVERLFVATSPQPVAEAATEERLAKEIRFDPDVWIVETEDRRARQPAGPGLHGRAALARRRAGAMAFVVVQHGAIFGARHGHDRAAPGRQH